LLCAAPASPPQTAMQAGTASAEPCPPEIEVEVEEHEDGEEADEDVEGADAGGSDSASAKKQRKNKSTRWNIPKSALQTLEQMFERDKFPSVETRKKLAQELNVTPRQVQVWFQNKRQRSVKPPATRNAPQGDRNYLSTSDEIKAALMNLCSTGHVDPTRPQQDVMLEDSIRSLESSPAAASRSGEFDMWTTAAQAASTAASRSASGQMGASMGVGGATDLGAESSAGSGAVTGSAMNALMGHAMGAGMSNGLGPNSFNLPNEWSWNLNALAPLQAASASNQWGLFGDGLRTSVGQSANGSLSDALYGGSSPSTSLASNLPVLQQWLAMQQGGISAQGLGGVSTTTSGMPPASASMADSSPKDEERGKEEKGGTKALASSINNADSFNLAEAMKSMSSQQGACGGASGVPESFPFLRNHYFRNAAMAEAATRGANNMQHQALVSDAVLAAAANSQLPLLSGGQGQSNTLGDGTPSLSMMQHMRQILALQNARHAWAANQSQQQGCCSIDSAQHMPTMSQPPKGAQQPPKQPKQPPGTAQQSQKRNRPSEPSSTADQISSSSKSQREADSAPKCGVDLVRSNLSDDLSDLGLDRNSAIERASIQQDFDGSAQSDADVQAKVQAQVQRQQHLLQMQQQLLQRAPQVRQQMQQMQQIQQMQQMQQIPSHMRQLIQQQMQLQMLQRQQVQMQHQKQQQLIQAHMQQQQRRQLQLQQKQAQEANLVQEAAEHQALQRQQIDQQLARQLQSPSTPHQVSEDVPSTLQGTQPAPHPQRQAQPHRVAPQQSPAQQEQSALSTAPSDDSQAQPDPFEQSPPAESTQSETLTNSAGRMGADFPHVTSYGSFSQFSGGDADLMDEMINSLFTEQGAGGEFNKANLFSSLFGTASEAADTSMECDAMAPYASAPSVSLSNDGSFTGRRQTGGASMASNPCSTTTRSELSAFSEGQSSSPPSSLGSSENADYLGLTNDLLRDSPPGSRPATD